VVHFYYWRPTEVFGVMACFNWLADVALSLCSPREVRQVRTTADPPMAPEDALKLLKDSNSQVKKRTILDATTSKNPKRKAF